MEFPGIAALAVLITVLLLSGPDLRAQRAPVETRLPAAFRLPDGRAMPEEVSLPTMRRLLEEGRWDPAFNTGMYALGWTWSRATRRAVDPMSPEDEIAWLQTLTEACRRIDEPGVMEVAQLGLLEILPTQPGFEERELIGVQATLAEARYRLLLPAPDPEGSVTAADAALALAARLGLEHSEDAGRARIWRALARARLGHRDEAKASLDAMIDGPVAEPEPTTRVRARNARAVLLAGAERHAEALEDLERAWLDPAAQSLPALEQAVLGARLGYAALRIGRIRFAVETLTEAARSIDHETGWRHGHRHRVWLELGRALAQTGRFRDAEHALRRALDTGRQSNGAPRAAVNVAPRLELARLQRWLGDANGAAERIEELIALLPVDGDELHPLNTDVMLEAIRLRIFRGEDPGELWERVERTLQGRSAPAIEQRLEVRLARLRWDAVHGAVAELVPRGAGLAKEATERLGAAAPLARESLHLHGTLLARAGRPDLAVGVLRRAIADGEAGFSPGQDGLLNPRLDRILAHRALIVALTALGRKAEAAAELDVLEASTTTLLRELLTMESENLRLAARQYTDDLASLALALDLPERAAELVVRRKGLVIESVMVDDALDLAAAQSAEAAEAVRVWRRRAPPPGDGRARLRTGYSSAHQAPPTERDLEELEQRTGVTNTVWRALGTDLAAVRRALPPGAALVEYHGYPDYDYPSSPGRLAAFVVPAAGPVRAVDLGEVGPVFRRIPQVRGGWGPEAAGVVEELAQRLLPAVLAALPADTTTLIVAPVSRLHFVPFPVLPTGDGRALVERFRLVQVDSGRDLLAPVAGRATGPVAVLAAPSFASAPAAVVLAGMPRLRSAGLHALPAARLEGQAVAQAAGPGAADVAAGWEATEAWLRERRQPRWLHLATHAFVLPPPDPFSAEAEWLWEPMERAAIALAGAGDTLAAWYRGDRPAAESDGVLTAAEVGRLDLRGTELVVVSACDSAAGAESNAEGVLGLGRGFFRAGARQVMLSLAPVEDEETAEFMTAFYGRLAAGETPVEALNRLQRERIERARRAGAPVPHLQAGPWILGMRGGL